MWLARDYVNVTVSPWSGSTRAEEPRRLGAGSRELHHNRSGRRKDGPLKRSRETISWKSCTPGTDASLPMEVHYESAGKCLKINDKSGAGIENNAISLFYREKTGNFVDSASNRRDRSLLTH